MSLTDKSLFFYIWGFKISLNNTNMWPYEKNTYQYTEEILPMNNIMGICQELCQLIMLSHHHFWIFLQQDCQVLTNNPVKTKKL